MPSLVALPLFLFFSFFLSAQEANELYERLCASCHGKDRLGRTAPPLIPEFLKRRSDEELARIIREGLPASQMPAFPQLTDEQLKALVELIKSPVGSIKYGPSEIKASRTPFNRPPAEYRINRERNLVVAVDKAGEVYLLEDARVLDRFSFKNVHGGVKFSTKNRRFYVPARDGWVAVYDWTAKKPLYKVRACVYLRNVALTPDEEKLAVSCVLPKALVLLDKDLRFLEFIPLKGRPSAVYELTRRNALALAFRDLPAVAVYRDGELKYYPTSSPLEDYFIDPFEAYLVGTSRKEKRLVVFSLDRKKEVFTEKIESMPHLFSASFWYRDGAFYFATRHTDGSFTVWRLYDWKKVYRGKLPGKGFFVRTHPKNPYLWLDEQSPYFTLVSKKDLSVQRKRLTEEGILTHVEFSGDGKLYYLSRLGRKPGLVVGDAFSYEPYAELPLKRPAGKYSILLKTRKFLPALLGYEVYLQKCWGCHHTTREAFGPPFKEIALKRPRSLIVAQILNPEKTYKLLGYERNAMPKIELSPYELEAVLSFMEVVKDGWLD
ncbi:MAG: c-type cytochrome [Aquificae bacterium]|nr:c-type cytochrome [Aquificota bacterium]